MKKILKIGGIILAIALIGGAWFAYTPVDLRPDYLGDKIAEKDYIKGKALLNEMQTAYGGMDNWLAHKTGSYAQVADWYEDKMGISGWDALPQQFEMTSILGTDDSEFTLLNGANKGQTWGVENWKTYQNKNGQKEFIDQEQYHHKLTYKNYWFQFPFRIGEAPIIAYAGQDQYILYLDKETRLVEWLHFTLRDKFNFLHPVAQFTDFKKVNGIMVPFNQYITQGTPIGTGSKFHENRYQWIQFGEEKVER